MNEEAILDGYKYFVSTGYNGTIEDYKSLINSNPEALSDTYKYFLSTGYNGSEDNFSTLMGVKKKEDSEPSLETEVVTESITEQAPAEDGLSVSQQDERIFDPMAVEPEVAPATEQRIAEPSISQEQVQRLDEATPKISPELTTEERLAEQPYVSPEELSRMAREKSKEDELIYLPQTGETISRRDPYKGTILAERKSEFDDLQESLSLIDDEKIESQEEIVVPEMNYNFGRYGFTFEETGGGDAMVVTAANRKKLYVNLDPFLGLNSKESARELRNFIRENKTELKDANQLVKIKDESKIKDAVAVLNAQTEKFYKQEKEHIKRIAEYNESYKKFEGLTFQQLQANPELYKEYLSFQETQKNLLSEQKTIDLRQEQLKAKGAELDRLVGEYTTMKGKQGTLMGGMAKNIRKGIALPFAELISQAHDVDVYVDENATMSEEDYVKAISKIAKDEGLVDKDENLEGLSKEELVKKLGGDTNDLVYVKNLFKVFGLATKSTEAAIAAYSALKDSGTPFDRANRKLIDTIKKGYRRGIVGGDADYFQLEQTLKPRTRSRFSETADYAEEQKILTESVTDVIDNVLDYIPIDAPEASKEFVEQERQKGIIKQGLYGLAESIPSFIGGGPFSRRARMFLFTTSFVKDEMEKNPEFENISENEKKLITIPIALASAYLEERGLRNVLSQRGFLSNLLLRVFKKVPKGATAKTFQRFVAEEVESAAARGALIVGSGALAEFETGFSQQLVELGVKEIYNQVKEKDMFNTPDSIGGWLKQSFEAGLAEAVGGFTMATIPASVSAIKGKRLRTVSNEQFDLFKSILKDPNYKDMYMTDLKQRIASGELTVEQAKAEEKDFNRIQAAAQQIPDGYTEQQQKAALELLYQKQELTEQIEGKDPQLVKSKQRQLDEVNKQLENILETTETEQEIEESIPEMRPKTEEKQEPTDIEVFFQEQEGRETISENLFVNNKGKDKLAPERINKARKIVLTAAKQGAKSIAKLLPNTQIILHETQEEFERYTNKKGRGSIDFKEEGGSTIHINLEKATASTVPHEIFHAVFLDKVKTDKRAQKVANQMVLSIKKTLPKNSELAKRIDAFSKQYTGELQEQQQEEYVAELIGLLSSNEFNYTQLSKPAKNKIVQFFKDLAKIFGINLGQDFGKTDESVIDLINTLAQKTRTGEELTEEDVLDIETLSKEDKELKDDEQELESREQKISNEEIQAIKKVSELSTSIQKSLDFADKSAFNNKLEFKKSLQDRFNKDTYNKIKETYNVKDNKSNNDPGLKNYLIDAYLNETLTAIEAYPDALGWYDSRINGAMSFMEELHPELATDKNAESTFKIALAITSNGNKVYDNFVEANRQYEYFKENGKFDENYSIGDQKNGILSTLRFTNKALQSMSMSEFTNFLTSKYRAGDLKYIKDGKKTPLLPGFAVDEEVYGASIFGPKIGNGFFMNLYGEFNQLTMDRWFMRQYGRITGTLLDFDQAKVDKGDVRLKKAIKALGVKRSKVLESIVPDFKNISNEELANKIQKASMDLKKRALFKSDIKLDEVRKAGNNLSKLYSAEVEAPKNSSQRKFINEVFSELQSKLKEDYGIDITIADLQAVNWYPEKALYQTFKADQNIKQGKVNTSDNEQPDYQSAARKFIKTKGISENKIKENERRRSEQTKREDTNRKSIEQGARQFNKNNIEPSEIKRLKDKIISIKEEVTSNDLKESKETTPASREQIIGDNANLSKNVRANLEIAKNMEAENKSAKDIRIATGWERSKDGWKYETEPLILVDGFDYKKLKRHRLNTYKAKLKDIINNPELLRLYDKKFVREYKYKNVLGTVGKLFQNYGPIGDINVFFQLGGLGDGVKGYLEGNNDIYISVSPNIKNTNEIIREVLTHEVQHYIQLRENFGVGGDPSQFYQTEIGSDFGQVNALRAFGDKLFKKTPKLGFDVSENSEAAKIYKDIFGSLPSKITIDLALALNKEMSRGINLNDTKVYKVLQQDKLSPFEKYKRLAGETEARNVMKRLSMTPEQRQKTLLKETEDVAESDKIYITAQEEFIKRFEEDKFSVDEVSFSKEYEKPASREQKDLIDTITEARFGGFTNDEIKDYLVRVRKFAAKKVDALLKMNVSDFEELPKSFANMKGGVKEGLKLYDKVKKYRIKLEQNNKKRTKLTNTQLNEKVKEFERKQKEPIQKKKDIEIQAREFRAKEEARNKKRKNKLTPNQINEKVRDFRDNKLKERTAAIDEAVLKTEEYRLKETRKNDKRKPILTSQQIMDKTIEYLESQPEFKNEAGERKSLSIQQAKMIVEFQRNSKIKPTETVFEKIVKLKTRIRTEKQTEIDLNKTKSQLRNFMRSVLPRTLDLDENKLYNKLIDNIVKANQTNLINLQKEVLDFAISENVKALKEEFNNLLKGKYIAIQSGRPVAKTVDAETKVLIDGITNNLVEDNDSVTAEEIGATQEKLIKQVNELEKILDKTEEDTQRINALYVAINYNQSILMSDTDINKIDMLETAVDLFNGIVTIGKSKLNEILKKQSEEYRVEFERLYEDITGVSVDLNPDQSQEELAEEKKKLEERRIEKNRAAENKKVINNFRTTLSKIADRIDEALNSNNSLPDVMTRISKLPGEMMGGVAMELVADRIDSATRLYKQRRMENESIIKAKLEEIFGKKWTDKINNFKKANNEIVINLEKYNKISEDYDNNPNGITKRALVKALSEQARIYSQNQMYYLYNQFKDPSNMASFSNMFAIEPVNTGDSKAEIERKQKINQQNAERVMKEIEEKIDPKLKDFADWQVNEFFPELYKYYNQAYKDIYRTNLPYNEFYAGRLYKDIEQKEINMITEGNQFRNSFIGVASTKGRIDNSDAIIAMDGTNALFSYLNDMEYFSAYARPLTNIYKLFNNKYIKDSITSIHGDWVMKMINGSLEVIAKRGKGELSSADKWLNRFNNYFVVSRIAISPVIMIKQLTSVFTYANDMGIRKWSLYSVKNLPEARKTWKEIRDNSVYMQDRRYDSIAKVLTSYAESGIVDFDPKNKIDRGIRFATSLVKFGDRTAIMVGGMANYNFYKDQYRKSNPNATEQEVIDYAVRKFERDTKRTQQSSDLQDRDMYQNSKSAFLKGALAFQTTPRQYQRKVNVASRELGKKILAWDKKAGKGTVGQNIRQILMYHAFMPAFFQWTASGFPIIGFDWDEEDSANMLRAVILGNINSYIVLGQLSLMISDVISNKPWAGDINPSLGIFKYFGRTGKLAARWMNTKDPVKKEEAFNKLIVQVLSIGSPSTQIARFYENYNLIQNENLTFKQKVLLALQFSKYQVIGKPKKRELSIAERNAKYRRRKK